MGTFERLRAEVAAYLRGALCDSGAEILEEYPARERKNPPKGGCVAVGLDGAELPGGGRAEITLRFDFLCRNGCHRLFGLLCGALLEDANPFGFYRVSCGDQAYDEGLRGETLTARARMRLLLTPEEPDAQWEPLREAVVVRKDVE